MLTNEERPAHEERPANEERPGGMRTVPQKTRGRRATPVTGGARRLAVRAQRSCLGIPASHGTLVWQRPQALVSNALPEKPNVFSTQGLVTLLR